MPWLINTAQLEKFRNNQKNVLILDTSVHHEKRDAKAEFSEQHIPGAQFFDIEAFSDPNSDLPHTVLRNEAKISEILGSYGMRNDSKIIFYDNSELHSSCRALWLFKVFGHNPNQLYILDGGLKAWLHDRPQKFETGEVMVTPKKYTAEFQAKLISSIDDVKINLKEPNKQILDMRHPVRFAGGTEIRPGLRQGHIPGSFCLPFYTLFDKNNKFISLDALKKKFIEMGVDINTPIISSCGSGITAAILDFLLDLLKHKNHTVYDGSWSEWGKNQLYLGETSLNERPIATCLDN